MKYLNFTKQDRISNKKTDSWNVSSIYNSSNLAIIKWYSPWRKYCAFINAIFDKNCLEELSIFLDQVNKEYKQSKVA